MPSAVVKKPKVELTAKEQAALDKRMAAAIAAGITHEDFRQRFKRDPREEMPRIRQLFKIKPPPRYARRSGQGWAY